MITQSHISNNIMRVFLCSIYLFLVACGGTDNDTALIEGTGGTGAGDDQENNNSNQIAIASIGVIKSDSEVLVNGVSYDVKAAQIDIDGDNNASSADLLKGQVVFIEGELESNPSASNKSSIKTAKANAVIYNSNVIGPIRAIDYADLGFTILGQNITVDTNTVYGLGLESFESILHSQNIRVSGLVSANGEVLATRLDSIASDGYQITGAVKNVDPQLKTFEINQQVVNYANLNLAFNLDNDMVVIVRADTVDSNGVLVANDLRLLSVVLNDSGQTVSIDGLITDFDTSANFSVSNFPVLTNNDTLINNGQLDDLGLDARIEILGKLNEQGLVVAESIVIIHTGPTTYSGFLETDKHVIYTIESSDADTALWVRVKGLDGFAGLYVNTGQAENEWLSSECLRLELSNVTEGFCYLENNGATQWQIILESYKDTNYEISAYFRRAPLNAIKDIAEGEQQTINLKSGDRDFYRLSTVNAPLGSFLAVTAEGLEFEQGSFLQIVGSGDNGAGIRECRIGNAGSLNSCWLSNENINEWYLILASGIEKNYTLNIDFINSQNLSGNQVVNASVLYEQGMLYQIDTLVTDASVSALLENINPSSRLLMQEHTPPYGFEVACRKYVAHETSYQQCILENKRNTTWYALVRGEVGSSYTLSTQLQTQEPAIQTLTLGSSVSITQQAGVIARYEVPQGDAGSAFFARIIDDGNADFEVSVKRDPSDYLYTCRTKSVDSNDRHCRAIQEGVGNWYITVKSAKAGDYTLEVEQQSITPITLGIPLDDQIQNAVTGNLYSLNVPAANQNLSVNIGNKTLATQILLKDLALPYTEFLACADLTATNADSICELFNYADLTWYIVVAGDANAQYTLTANTD